MNTWRIMAATGLLLTGCAVTNASPPGDVQTAPPANDREAIARAMAELDFGRPYLVDGLEFAEQLAPPPPADRSPMLARDRASNRAALALRDQPRWFLAVRDADLRRGAVLASFSCAAGRELSDSGTPAIANLLRRSRSDFGRSTSGVKALYQRERPFMMNAEQSCTPEAEAYLRRDGSYPSGHSAIGYGTGLVLAALLPDRAVQLVARGISYGDSRRICNVHWASDVEAARPMADATFARLWSEASFREDFAEAKAELDALPGKDEASMPAASCELEAAAMAGD